MYEYFVQPWFLSSLFKKMTKIEDDCVTSGKYPRQDSNRICGTVRTQMTRTLNCFHSLDPATVWSVVPNSPFKKPRPKPGKGFPSGAQMHQSYDLGRPAVS